MTIDCKAARELLLDTRGGQPSEQPELREALASLRAHLVACAECSEQAARTVRVLSALSSLSRVEVPRRLEGLTVATFYEGFRQDRAVAALRSLGRLSTPRELSGRTLRSGREVRDPLSAAELAEAASSRPRVPAVLDRLVDENLRRGSADAARRFASRLDRLRAPRVLRGRIEGSARALFGRALFGKDGARTNRLAAAAAVLVLFGGAIWLSLRSGKEAASLADFQVRYETSLDAMDPMARSLLGGLSGGFVEATGKARKL